MAVAVFVGSLAAAPAAFAYIPGDGKGSSASDCFSGLEGYDARDLSPFGRRGKPAIQCTDGDTCDLDGSVNGSCQFSIAIAVNKGGVAGCTPKPLSKVKVRTRPRVFPTSASVHLPLDGSSAVSAFIDFPVPMRGFGTATPKSGKGLVFLFARQRKDDAPKDRDRFRFVCNPTAPDGTLFKCSAPCSARDETPLRGPAAWRHFGNPACIFYSAPDPRPRKSAL